MAQIGIEEVSAAAAPAGFWDLLALSVGGPTVEKLEHVKASYAEPDRGLAAAFAGGRLAGIIGYRRRHADLEITHLAVRDGLRRRGVARALISAVARRHAGFQLTAETDDEAVGFYRAIGFMTEALPREMHFTQRWRCRLPG